MQLDFFLYAGIFLLASLLCLHFFKPRLHWGLTLVSALLAGSLFLALEQWAATLGLWSYSLAFTSGLFFGAVPLEQILFYITAPLFFSIFWQTIKQRVKS